MKKNIILVIFILVSPALARAGSTHEDSLVKVFNDVCYMNREHISKIPALSSQLNWKKSEDKDLFDIQKYKYKNYTILLKSGIEEEICAVIAENNEKQYGYQLSDIMLSRYKPIGKVLNTAESYADKGLPVVLKHDTENNYIKSWIIDGGFKIQVSLTDLEYQGIEGSNKRFVSLELSRF